MSLSQRIYLDKIHETHGITRDVFEGLIRHEICPEIAINKAGRAFITKGGLLPVINKLMSLYIKTADAAKLYEDSLEEQKKILDDSVKELKDITAEPVADVETN